jgi:hypothetical protein
VIALSADPGQRDRIVERGDDPFRARNYDDRERRVYSGATPKAPGAAATAALFRDIPQQLNQLGNPKAKVTMIEFADPQCPFCRQYELETLPTIVKEYVPNGEGQARLLRNPDHRAELRGRAAGRVCRRAPGQALEFFPPALQEPGRRELGVDHRHPPAPDRRLDPGFDTQKMLADRQSAEVDAALSASTQQATNGHVDRTPTFFAGPTGATLQQIALTALSADAFRPTLDALIN